MIPVQMLGDLRGWSLIPLDEQFLLSVLVRQQKQLVPLHLHSS